MAKSTEYLVRLEWHVARAEATSDPYAFRPGRRSYVRIMEGGAAREAFLSWDERLLQGLTSLDRRGLDTESSAELRSALHDFVVALGGEQDLERLLAESAAGRPSRLVLRFAAAELYALPWEALPVGPGGEALALLPGLSLQYGWPGVQVRPSDPSPRPTGGRILLAWSAAGGPVPHEEHTAAIRAASGDGRSAFKATPVEAGGDVLAHATSASLAATLADARTAGRPFAVLHLLAHGQQMEGSDASGVLLDGPDGSVDRVGPEELRMLLAPHVRQLRMLLLAACHAGDGGSPGSRVGSLAQAVHREGMKAVIAPRELMSVACSIRLTTSIYHGLIREHRSLELALCATRRTLLESLGPREALNIQLYASPDQWPDIRVFIIPPYRGLMAFKTYHERFFFGREAERDELVRETLALVANESPTVMFVVGASGAGKSSLVMAGLLPALAKLPGARWTSSVFKPGATPLVQLEEAAQRPSDEPGPHLVVVDQFEEIFTHLDTNIEREQFARRLWALAEDNSRNLHFVLVIRVDYLGRCGEISLQDGRKLDRIAYMSEHHVFVPEMDPANLRRVIEEPARIVGLELQPGLTDTILAEVGAAPGGLPVLEFTLEQTWKARKAGMLTLEAYRTVGGVGGALTRLAERLWEQVSDGGRDPELATARMFRRILVGLVGFQREAPLDTRRRVPLEELLPVAADVEATAAFSNALDMLERQRLIVVSVNADGGSTVEVAHEALIRYWSRLREWVDFDRIKLDQLAWLRRAVLDWEQFGEPRLLRDDELRHAQRIAERWEDDVTDRQRELLASSVAAEEARSAAWAAELRAARDMERLLLARERLSDPTLAAALLAEVESPDDLRGWRQAVAEVLRHPLALDGWDVPGAPLADASLHPDGERVVVGTRGGALWVWSARGGPRRLLEAGPAVLLTRFVRSGASLLVVDAAGSIRRWSMAALDREPERWTPTPAVLAATADPSGAWVMIADPRGSLLLFDLHAGTTAWTWSGTGADTRTLSSEPTGERVTATFEDGTAVVVQLGAGAPEAIPLRLPDDPITHAATGSGDVLALTGTWMGRVHRWRASAKDSPVLLVDAADPISILALEPDGRSATVGAFNGRLWRVHVADAAVSELPSGGRSVVRAASRPDGAALAIARVDGGVLLVDPETGALLQDLRGLSGDIVALSFARAQHQLLTATVSGIIRIWPGATGPAERALAGHTAALRYASFSPDGARVVTSSVDGTARIWSLSERRPPRVLEDLEHRGPYFASFSPDGRRVMTVSREEGAIQIWEADESRPPRVIQAHNGDVKDAWFLPSGREIVTCGDDAAVRVWSLDREGAPLELRGHARRVSALAVDERGSRVLSASWDGTARVWSLQDPSRSILLEGHTRPVLCVAVSPDGRWVATGSSDGTARLWRLEADEVRCVSQMEGHGGRVLGVSFHPYALRVATASSDATAGLWSFDEATGALESVRWLRGHTAELLDASFSPGDGGRVLTVSGDGTARVWVSLPSGEWEGIALTGHAAPLRWGEFSPDGTRVVTASMDGTARVWDVRYDDLPGRLREMTRYRPTAEARTQLGGEVRGG